MSEIVMLSREDLVERINRRLKAFPYQSNYSHYALAPEVTPPALYVLIVGAGFSSGVVPLVNELMHESIGGYFYPDQDMSSLPRPVSVLRRDSANFWKEFNAAAARADLPTVVLNRRGLPEDPGLAYRTLFTYEALESLLRKSSPRPPGFVDKRLAARAARDTHPAEGHLQNDGERFLQGLLRYVMDPGAEHGYGSSGRRDLNLAHIYLGAILEAQQRGRGWRTRAFCRTIFTTNFDTLLQHALQVFNLPYLVTDRPAKGLDASDFPSEEAAIHLVYTHGSILRYNPANTSEQLDGLASVNARVLREQLESREIIAVGYSGWDDALMAALKSCDTRQQNVYWCDIRPQPPRHVFDFLRGRGSSAFYVPLGDAGANGLMRTLYESLVDIEYQRRDPMDRYRHWCALGGDS